MGFNLTGYEKDNIGMKSFAIYTTVGVIALILVIVATSFYMFLEVELAYNENVTEAQIEETVNYKEKESQFLNSHSMKEGIGKALDYYNE